MNIEKKYFIKNTNVSVNLMQLHFTGWCYNI